MQQVLDFLETFLGKPPYHLFPSETFHHFWLNGTIPCIYVIFYLSECNYSWGNKESRLKGDEGFWGFGVWHASVKLWPDPLNYIRIILHVIFQKITRMLKFFWIMLMTVIKWTWVHDVFFVQCYNWLPSSTIVAARLHASCQVSIKARLYQAHYLYCRNPQLPNR